MIIFSSFKNVASSLSTDFEIPALFSIGLQAKTVKILKCVDDEALLSYKSSSIVLIILKNTYFWPNGSLLRC